MAGVGGIRRARGLAILVIALVALVAPAPVDAADDGSVVLASDALTSMVADLDGDGDREVVAIRRHPDDSERLIVEAWGTADGGWASIGSASLERWDAEESGPQPARFGLEGYALLALRDGSSTRAIVATVTEDGDDVGGGCCLSISVVGIGEAGIAVDLVGGSLGGAESLQVADVDGDRVDEVVVSRTLSYDNVTGAAVGEHALLRQTRDGFDLETIGLPGGGGFYLAVSGETDGVPGDDLHFVEQFEGQLLRVVDDAGTLRVETSAIPVGSVAAPAWPVGAANGLLVLAEDQRVTAMRWPRGAQPEDVVVMASQEFPSLVPLGQGPTARWVDLGASRRDSLAMRVLDADLRIERQIDAAPLTAMLWDLNNNQRGVPSDRYLWEHVGPIPGGLAPDRSAVLGYGALVEVAPDGHLEVRPAAHLVGVGVMGVAGSDGAWLAVAGEWYGWGGNLYLGNMGYEPPYGMVGVIPVAALLDATGSELMPVELSGVTVGGTSGDERIFTAGDAFEVTVTGAPGDLVVVNVDRRVEVEEMPDAGALTLTIDVPGRDNANREFDLAILRIGPTGLTQGVSWQAEALRVAPDVTASATGEGFSLTSTISGQAAPGATLTVDGLAVTPSSSGHFRVEVDAPIWPRDVLVVARDAVGNETVQQLEVIGFVDYRGLPWIPIIAVLTVVAGVVLFLRTPRLRPQPVLMPDGDGRLEELDGDSI
jgi:hypothetical protein